MARTGGDKCDADGGALLLSAIGRISRLHFRLGALAERLHGQGLLTAGRRALLRNLKTLGPRTVPELAAMRPVSRQHIQMLVNELLRDGLVVLADNPAHRRSKHVRITAKGKAALAAMEAREAPLVKDLAGRFSRRDLARLDSLLARLGNAVDAEARGADGGT